MIDRKQIKQEIALLEGRLAETLASKPAHDTTGAYEARLLEIEDELAEKHRTLAEIIARDGPK